MLKENLKNVQNNIKKACERGGSYACCGKEDETSL